MTWAQSPIAEKTEFYGDGKSAEKITEALTKKFPDADAIEKDIIGMIEMALEKAWIEKTN